MTDTPTDYMVKIRGVAEELGVSGIKREIEDATRYIGWIRQSAERTPWRFSIAMYKQIVAVQDDLERALSLIEEWHDKQAEQDNE